MVIIKPKTKLDSIFQKSKNDSWPSKIYEIEWQPITFFSFWVMTIRYSKSNILIHSTPVYLEQLETAFKWSIKEPFSPRLVNDHSLNANYLLVYFINPRETCLFPPILHSKIQTQIIWNYYGCWYLGVWFFWTLKCLEQ